MTRQEGSRPVATGPDQERDRHLGTQIKYTRVLRRIAVDSLAAAIGLSPTELAAAERGDRPLSEPELIGLMQHLQISDSVFRDNAPAGLMESLPASVRRLNKKVDGDGDG